MDIEVREGRERRRGVVMFKEEEEARKAVEAMDGGSIDLQQIVVSLRLQTCLVNYPKIPNTNNLLPKYFYNQTFRYDMFFTILAPASRAGQTTTTILEVSRSRCLEATRPPARSHWTWKLLNHWHCFFELQLFSKQ